MALAGLYAEGRLLVRQGDGAGPVHALERQVGEARTATSSAARPENAEV